MNYSRDIHARYVLLFCLLNIVAVLFVVLLSRLDYLPPPPFSGSISFDEKMSLLQEKISQPIEVLAVGSSMTLNNLHSEGVREHLGGSSYFNTASWGLLMRQNFQFTKYLLRFVDPSLVVICSDIEDFQFDEGRDVLFNEKITTYYLNSGDSFSSHLLLFSGNYFRGNITTIKDKREYDDRYSSLKFDPYGGVMLSAGEEFQRIESRWEGASLQDLVVDQRNYDGLVKLAQLCNERSIRLLFAMTPARSAVYEQRRPLFDTHGAKLAQLAEQYDFFYINLDDAPSFGDELFVDWSHLNERGARIYTDYVFSKYNEMSKTGSVER